MRLENLVNSNPISESVPDLHDVEIDFEVGRNSALLPDLDLDCLTARRILY